MWDESNAKKTRKVHVDGNKFCPGKNGDHYPSGLGGRLVVVVKQAVNKWVSGKMYLQFTIF